MNGTSFGMVEICFDCKNDFDCSYVSAVLYVRDLEVTEIGFGDQAVADDHLHAVVALHRRQEGTQTCLIRGCKYQVKRLLIRGLSSEPFFSNFKTAPLPLYI